MAIEHIGEEQIQEYLDGVLTPPEHADVKAHLDSCAQCRRDLAEYRTLYHALAEQPVAELPEDFAKATTRRAIDAGRPRFNPVWLWPVAAVAVLTAVHLWFVDLGPVWNGLAAIFAAQLESVHSLLHKLELALSDSGQGGRLLLGAILSMLMVAALDRITRALRRGRTMLLS